MDRLRLWRVLSSVLERNGDLFPGQLRLHHAHALRLALCVSLTHTQHEFAPKCDLKQHARAWHLCGRCGCVPHYE